MIILLFSLTLQWIEVLLLKKSFGHSQGPASGQNNIHENSRKTFFIPLTTHKPTHNLVEKKKGKDEIWYKCYTIKII